MYKRIFPSIASLKCTHSDRQMYHLGYMYPSLGTPALADALVWDVALVRPYNLLYFVVKLSLQLGCWSFYEELSSITFFEERANSRSQVKEYSASR